MAKEKKPQINPVPREAIADVADEGAFVDFLRRQLEWPIPVNIERLADVSIPHDLQRDFGFNPGEDRINVSRLLNLSEDQPWGIFLFEFKTKRPYLSHLRRLLRTLSSSHTLRKGNPIWDRDDILFICTPDWQQYQFVHFSGERAESAVISSFGWKSPSDPFLHTLCKHNLPRLRMPEPLSDAGFEHEQWRSKWRDAFSVKPVTDEFYTTLKEVFDAVQAGVKGLKGENRRFFAELVVNRMVFLKFVEKKGWLDGDPDYLVNRFKARGKENFWRNFLCDFFFEGLCKEKEDRSAQVNKLLGDVPFLNGELFAPSDEWDDWSVQVDNRVFDILFDKLLNPFNFTVSETSPLDVEVAFNQDLLGYGYEELIADQHGQGAYYTQPTEVNLMCRESLRAYLEGKCPDVGKDLIGRLVYGELTQPDQVSQKDALALYRALHNVTVVDPALGSGTFPVAMMKHLFANLQILGGYLREDPDFRKMLKDEGITDPDDAFALKLHIIERSIYGCDIDYFAVQIAKLRFWIELMVHCEKPEALPNFNFKLVVGDALVSVVGKDGKGNLVTLEGLLGHPTKGQLPLAQEEVERLASLKAQYFSVRDTRARKQIEEKIKQAREDLLKQIGISTERIKRTDRHVLWQIDFAEIFVTREPGFDIAIANPPYLRQELIDPSFRSFGLLVTKKDLLDTYKGLSQVEITAQADLYIYFFFRAFQLLSQGSGVCCFICSNSWLDVGYGQPLRRFIGRNLNIVLLFDSIAQRSFENAAVNTTINVFQMSSKLQRILANFVSARTAITDLPVNAIHLAIRGVQSSLERNAIRYVPVQNQQLVVQEKWGAYYLKAPDIFHEVANRITAHGVRLGSIGKIRRGLTTGCNEFFYLDSKTMHEWNIEGKYLAEACRGPRDVKGLVITGSFPFKLFCCHSPMDTLTNSCASRYIKWGEKQGYDKRPTVATREIWYDIGSRAASQLCVNHRVHRTMRCYYNTGDTIIGDNFHEIYDLSRLGTAAVFLSINSSILQLWIQTLGRVNFGDGLLEWKGYELEELPILKVTSSEAMEIDQIFKDSIATNSVEAIAELSDFYVSKKLSISREMLYEIRRTVIDLVENRLNKASKTMEI